ncbi:LytTR family DNA-binding domain-containing protein [Undibacterium sp. RTI2.1]|uniref:LytR/AlgR family response regulator transcription factor n=1 Tax=unclassified Undibacterium TaxID=2630295 RepID=UPI002AB59BCC|nr:MULTISPECIES: LytTR family DNA-binding domain-containing protein [unclassified Undibacterium]MDY7536863.1 LytTR family DNA-binding domain-containing protein [Undibacterium sp. 5I1]MEB0029472.1 LytTR family DNA-binding domain-containing protein [Undibacterium sp. RTI2.1]MEB0115658.1 LytTR family DNA-binding domain-containing protein [Undibacterium sp. RTI2.2]MEB0230368.1 LytTR family DNA-binding domain-containing protein [Undibacterium sp. 10I3]MEB0256745.1 LytTR family DNA-binding domain-co
MRLTQTTTILQANAKARRALLAEDESLLRTELRKALTLLWPELEIVAEAADGINAMRLLQEHQPDIAFLDVRMPGLSGVDVARLAAQRCHIVFLTAYNEYAIQAFDQGAVDYLLKPLDLTRLAVTVQRLQEKLATPLASFAISEQQQEQKKGEPNPIPLKWIQASSGTQLRIININDVQCFRADAKYTKVVTNKFEALIRTTIKDLMLQLDPEKFWQISRSAIVSVAAIDTLQRQDNGLVLKLMNEAEWQTVSQAFQHRFRQM